MLYAIQHTNTETHTTTLCEVESHVVYEVGSRLRMMLSANKANLDARVNGWASHYRAVPLPFTGSVPDYAIL